MIAICVVRVEIATSALGARADQRAGYAVERGVPPAMATRHAAYEVRLAPESLPGLREFVHCLFYRRVHS